MGPGARTPLRGVLHLPGDQMKTRRIGLLAVTLALGFLPALAVSAHPGGGNGHKPSTPGPGASPGAKAKAYGKFCQGESKTHVQGQKGTPFSTCVTDMAKLAH